MALIKISKKKVERAETQPLIYENEIAAKIQQRRLQVYTHSYIYYELNDNIIDDATWSRWAKELVELQNKYPDIADKVIYADEFKGFTGDSGSHFKYDVNTHYRAMKLLRLHNGTL